MSNDPDAIASPWDLVRQSQSPLHPRFRRLEGDPPAGLPNGFTLGLPLAPGNDWSVFAEEANARGPVESDHRVLIAYAPGTEQDADDFAASLEAQIFAGKVTLVLRPITERELAEADTVVYLAGHCVLDPFALERICRMTRVSRLIAMPIVEAAARPGRSISVPATVADWPAAEPWREVRGLNIAVSAALARLAGPSGVDFAFRCHQRGAYFVPVFVRELVASARSPERTGPRASIIVVADGDAWAAGRSIESALRQSETDVEVFLWIKGPAARLWAALLKRRYKSIQVIHAGDLTDAIAASTGEFVGILEAGDRLGPEDLREALARFARADLAAVRIREASGDGATKKSWTRPSSERLLAMADTSGFVLLRRSAWARVGPADHAELFDSLSGAGLVETTRSEQFRRFAWRRRSSPDEGSRRIEVELTRRHLGRYWRAGKSDADMVVRKDSKRLVIFWPDYSRDNAYQRLLYGPAQDDIEYVGGDVDAAIAAARKLTNARTVFHIHWTNPIFRASDDDEVVRAEATAFLAKLAEFKRLGGSVVWTIHNVASHGTRHFEAEIEFARALVELADRVHIHAQSSLSEIEAHFRIPPAKLRVARHGNYLRAYADYIPRAVARAELGFGAEDDVLLFTGSLRAYKGPAALIAAFRQLLPGNPTLRLVLAGDAKGNDAPLLDGLSEAEAARITLVDRFLDNDELQLFLRAADAGVYPYDQILTSGSILLALSLGLPVVAPRFGMIEEAVEDGVAGFLYDRGDPAGLASAIARLLEAKRSGRADSLRAAALDAAARQTWTQFDEEILGKEPRRLPSSGNSYTAEHG